VTSTYDIARVLADADDATLQEVAAGMRAHVRKGPWWQTWWAALRDWARAALPPLQHPDRRLG
jgi:hypothetical protein